MPTTWILVAGNAAAHIYSARNKNSPLDFVESLAHPEGRQHVAALTGDTAGRMHDRLGEARHSLGDPQRLKAKERMRFARQIAAALALARRQKRFDRLVLVAEPGLLGCLRVCLAKSVSTCVVRELPHNSVGENATALRRHVLQIP